MNDGTGAGGNGSGMPSNSTSDRDAASPRTKRSPRKAKGGPQELRRFYPASLESGFQTPSAANRNALYGLHSLSKADDKLLAGRIGAIEARLDSTSKVAAEAARAAGIQKQRRAAHAAGIDELLTKVGSHSGGLAPHSPFGQVSEVVTRSGFSAPASAVRIFVLSTIKPTSGFMVLAADSTGGLQSVAIAAPQDDLAEAASSAAVLLTSSEVWSNEKNTVSSGTATARVLNEMPYLADLTAQLATDDLLPNLFTRRKAARDRLKVSFPALAFTGPYEQAVVGGSSAQRSAGAILSSVTSTAAGVTVFGVSDTSVLENISLPIGYRGRLRISADVTGNTSADLISIRLVMAGSGDFLPDYATIGQISMVEREGGAANIGHADFVFDYENPVDYDGVVFTLQVPIAVNFDINAGAFTRGSFLVELLDYNECDAWAQVIEIEGFDATASYEVVQTKHVSFIPTKLTTFQQATFNEFATLETQAKAQAEMLLHGHKPADITNTAEASFLGALKGIGKTLLGGAVQGLVSKI
eukprot:GHVU01214500.1.p1 GENE.GHVU01214500.1~~GHVU01214500.1.p1  ORF type:complete len:527 (-),score=72.58 GHVU01214500.1:646-2226(-)